MKKILSLLLLCMLCPFLAFAQSTRTVNVCARGWEGNVKVSFQKAEPPYLQKPIWVNLQNNSTSQEICKSLVLPITHTLGVSVVLTPQNFSGVENNKPILIFDLLVPEALQFATRLNMEIKEPLTESFWTVWGKKSVLTPPVMLAQGDVLKDKQ